MKRDRKTVKKRKGREWFNILAPQELGSIVVGQTTSIDPKSIINRNVYVMVSDLKNDAKKYYMRLKLKAHKIEHKNIHTIFNGFECLSGHIFRLIRKRLQKVQAIVDLNTKDNWKIRVKVLIMLNKNTTATIKKNVRTFVFKKIKDYAEKNNIYEFLNKVLSTEIQMVLKREISKIYPVRFSEVEKIKVLSCPVTTKAGK